jgi:transketolase
VRHAFVDTLVQISERDDSTVLLTGDLGYTVLEPFAERFPDRFFNVGVAEQNMMGLATGLALAGFKPYVYSIATFASMRPYEFLRNGPVLHELPVRLVGVGGGVDYGHNGPTHHALEDIGLMRLQPGLAIAAPADPAQTRSAVLATAEWPGPVYLRIGKDADDIAGLDGRFQLGRAQFLGSGTDVAIVTYGSITAEAIRAASLLEAAGIGTTIAVAASISPAPDDDLADLLDRVHLAVTLEAHYVTGGVGSLVCELVAERGLGCRVVRCGVTTVPSGASGERSYLYDRYGLSGHHVAGAALAALGRVR